MLRTNFYKEDLPKYAEALLTFSEKTNSDRLSIENKAYDKGGNLVEECHALHDRENSDLTLFWEIFDSINKQPTHNQIVRVAGI